MTTPDSKLVEECASNENGYEVIPEGWVKTTLQELLDVLESGSRPKGGVRGISEGIPSIGGEHLNSGGSFNFDSIKYVPQRFFERMNQGHIHINDILVVKDGATTGKVSLVRKDFPFKPAVVNEHVFICRPVKQLFSPFLFYFLFADEGQNRILGNFRGSAQGGINLSFAAGTTVLLAPTTEQKRITAKIEDLLPQVNAVKERLNRTSLIMKRFRQAVLNAACTGRLTEGWRERQQNIKSATDLLHELLETKFRVLENNEDATELPDIPDTWVWSPCECLCDPRRIITYGVIKLGLEVPGGIPVLRSSDVRWLYVDRSHVKHVSKQIADAYSRTFLEGGEVLVTVRGSLGGVAIVDESLAGFNISREVAVIPIHTGLDSRFFCLAIASKWSQNWLSEVTKGVTYEGINIRDLKQLPLPVPPITEQQEIVRRVESLFKLADAIEKRIEAAQLRADKLTQSILAKAFRGELVPTEAELARQEGRSYEQASVLLERIKAERGNALIK